MGMKLPGKSGKPREQSLVKPCLDLLALRGVFAWRNNSGAMKGEHEGKRWFMRFGGANGASDILGLLPGGRFLAVELKRPGNVPTEKQQAFIDGVRARGGAAFVVSSVRELDEYLQEVL